MRLFILNNLKVTSQIRNVIYRFYLSQSFITSFKTLIYSAFVKMYMFIEVTRILKSATVFVSNTPSPQWLRRYYCGCILTV
ncbi:hypothetical protein [Lutibacter sp.]|uniref:hypothetical protein n=1 Tax=Lutibacter sp. TaxID=1925666 RepID=UPI003562FC4F